MAKIISSPFRLKAYLMDVNLEELHQLYQALLQTGKVEIVGMTDDTHTVLIEVDKLQPDVLFLDLQSPHLHGVVIVEHVKKLFPHIQIVVLTGNKEYGIWAFEQQIADYIVKPYVSSRLDNTLEKLILSYYN